MYMDFCFCFELYSTHFKITFCLYNTRKDDVHNISAGCNSDREMDR